MRLSETPFILTENHDITRTEAFEAVMSTQSAQIPHLWLTCAAPAVLGTKMPSRH